MQLLKEALIGKNNIKNVSSDITTRINKREFSTGDVALLRNGNIGVIVFLSDIKDAGLYTGITVHETGSWIEADEDLHEFSGLALNSFKDNGESYWSNEFDIMKIQRKAISIDICKNDVQLYRTLTDKKSFTHLKESIDEALIGKHNIKNAEGMINEIRKKSDLQPGDMCLQRDGSYGVYIGMCDYNKSSKFNLSCEDEEVIVFLVTPDTENFQYYPIKYLTDRLLDKDGESEFDIIKVIRGFCDPKFVNNPTAISSILSNVKKYEKYFK